jgi:hypothetical protein
MKPIVTVDDTQIHQFLISNIRNYSTGSSNGTPVFGILTKVKKKNVFRVTLLKATQG